MEKVGLQCEYAKHRVCFLYYSLMIVLFSTQTTVNLLLPTPVFLPPITFQVLFKAPELPCWTQAAKIGAISGAYVG